MNRREVEAKVIARAWKDPSFKQQLEQNGVSIPESPAALKEMTKSEIEACPQNLPQSV